ncbi:T9SS type A sorting domain-containing protein [Halocola ammonii]
MKTSTLLFSFLFLVSYFCQSQSEWAPVGAQWHYESKFVSFSNGDEYYAPMLFTVTADTTVNGQTCSKVVQTLGDCCSNLSSANLETDEGLTFLTYAENDSIYFYDYHNESFKLVMDLGMQVGDTLTYTLFSTIGGENPYEVEAELIVLDEGEVMVNGNELRQLTVSAPTFTGVESITFTETLGFSHFFLVIPEVLSGFCDGEYPNRLRCYNSPNFGMYEAVEYECDTSFVITDISEIDSPRISVYPNPADESISLEIENLPTGDQLDVSILDLQGREVKSATLRQNQNSLSIDSSDLPNGTYFLSLKTGAIERTQKIIVQH